MCYRVTPNLALIKDEPSRDHPTNLQPSELSCPGNMGQGARSRVLGEDLSQARTLASGGRLRPPTLLLEFRI